MYDVKLPILVDVLFDNQQLELTRIMCVLSCFPKSRKGINVCALTYYYALSVSEFEFYIDTEQQELRYNVVNLYMDFQSKVKQLIIKLSNMNYIEVFGGVEIGINNVRVKLSKDGFEFIKDFENEYFHNLIKSIESIKKNHKYSKSLENELFERGIL